MVERLRDPDQQNHFGLAMTHTQFRNAIDHLEISQLGIAKLFGEKPRTIRRWCAGHSRIPSTAVILIRALILGELSKAQVDQLHD
jgi:hypothetical protein